VHNTNPAEELNYFGEEGLFYGYPYCWTSYDIEDYPRGTQFYQEQFSEFVTDEWCQNLANVQPPKLSMEAHMAPLDIMFWYNSTWDAVPSGDAFVAFHGSWNRSPPMGFRLDHVSFDSNGMPISNKPFLGYAGPGAYTSGWLRPCGLAARPHGGLFLSSDQSGQIILITN